MGVLSQAEVVGTYKGNGCCCTKENYGVEISPIGGSCLCGKFTQCNGVPCCFALYVPCANCYYGICGIGCANNVFCTPEAGKLDMCCGVGYNKVEGGAPEVPVEETMER